MPYLPPKPRGGMGRPAMQFPYRRAACSQQGRLLAARQIAPSSSYESIALVFRDPATFTRPSFEKPHPLVKQALDALRRMPPPFFPDVGRDRRVRTETYARSRSRSDLH